MSAMQLFHKVAYPCPLTEYRHRDKICTTFTVSSTALTDTKGGQPSMQQLGL